MTSLSQKKQGTEPVSWEVASKRELDALGPDARKDRLHALCLSGGGVRSAAYCLGVIQALARAGQLTGFHYLSTVSGGGYIGAWLQTMIRRYGVEGTQQRLAHGDPDEPGQEAIELRRLRRHTSWLTPNGGLRSLDGWTGVAIYFRNVLLNWLVFGPLFLLGALLAVAARTTFYALQTRPMYGGPLTLQLPGALPASAAGFLLAVGLGGLIWGAAGSCRGLPSRCPRGTGAPQYWAAADIGKRIVVPSLVWAFCIPPALAPFWGWVMQGPWWAQGALPLLFAVGNIAGYLLATTTRPAGTPPYWNNLTPWCMASLAGGAMLFAGTRIARAFPVAWAVPEDRAGEIVAIVGPGWLLLCYGVVSAVHAGLCGATNTPWRRHEDNEDSGLDTEWMARITAARLRIGLAWGGFAFCVLTLSHVLFVDSVRPLPRPAWIVALGAGPVVAWLGKQAFSQVGALLSGKPGLITWDLVLRAASAAFAVALLAGSCVAVQQVLDPMADLFNCVGHFGNPGCLLLSQALLGIVLLFLLCGADSWIKTNRFSMHSVYRDRLVRAFVGPARAERSDPKPGNTPRQADPFTDFDPRDNPKLSATAPHQPGWRLLPVINATLNLCAARRPDWANRKAAPFTMTPLHCGAAHLAKGGGRYVPTAVYAGAVTDSISLGTAMAVSGAAVSPNWGYHSSALTAFIMTLFNVRLGAWLPNPVHPELAAGQAGAPGWQLLKDELFAKTDDRRAYVYLSDGGHFDNLGLYEMLRRRCRLIAVVDATRDAGGGCADLGAVISKARIDMGVEIRLAPCGTMFEPSTQDKNGLSVGRICYHGGAHGWLLILKPLMTGDAPADVRAYQKENRTFPNEATTEQWFTEAQFESHRALGEHQARLAIDRLRRGLSSQCLQALRTGC